MYKKIKDFAENCWENRSIFRIFLVAFVFWFIVGCVITTVQNDWSTIFTYPEYDYQEIKEEADRIISNRDFETSYSLQITNYSNTEHSLSFDLRGKSNTLLTVNVKNYGLENEEISYKRFTKGPTSHILKELFAIILVMVMMALLSLFAILIATTIIWFIAFVIHKIVEHKQSKNGTAEK